MTHPCVRLWTAAVLIALLVPAIAAQDPPPEKPTATNAAAAPKAAPAAPAKAPARPAPRARGRRADERPAIAFVLGGTRLDATRLETAVRPLLPAGTRAIVPATPRLDDPRLAHFLTPGNDTTAVETALEGAYAVEVRKRVRAARVAGEAIPWVIALHDALDVALALVAEGQLEPERLVIFDPTPFGLADRLADASWPKQPPIVDVFFTGATRRHAAAWANDVTETLRDAKLRGRVFIADLRDKPIEARLAAARWPLRGLRFAAVHASSMEEVNADRVLDATDRYDVVFAGEQHDNLAFQQFELALLKRMDRGDGTLALSLEMFERDVQPLLDRYLAGEIDEATFLADARPWPNYAESYRALVEYARERSIPVIAANVPRRLAREVARGGHDALMLLSEEDAAFASTATHARSTAYRKRFKDVMPNFKGDALKRMYHAQCLKDDTMAESIDRLMKARPAVKRILHVNGSFHSAFSLGTAGALATRRPKLRACVITCRSNENPAAVDIPASERQDQFLVFAAHPPRKVRATATAKKPAHPPERESDDGAK